MMDLPVDKHSSSPQGAALWAESANVNDCLAAAAPAEISGPGDQEGKPKPRHPLEPTIFHEAWWLDVATGGAFAAVEVSSGGRIVGRLPFWLRRRFGLGVIQMPKLTYFLGPALDEGNGGPSTRFLKRLEITRELIRKLPPAAWQYVKCHRGVADTIAFQELGFRTFVQFTHEIAPGSGEILWRQMRDKTRNVIRRAEEQLSVGEFNDPDQFMQLFERNLRRKGSHNEIDRARCRNIITASIERRRGAILAARNRHQQVVAANFCVWDDTATFYLLATRSDNSGNGAGSLLLWKAIQDSARRGLIFDFAGLGGRGSILLYSGFGGAIRARYIALRATALARAAHELKLLFGQENCFY